MMDGDEIARLCEILSIEESDEPIVRLNKLVYVEGKERMDVCLIR